MKAYCIKDNQGDLHVYSIRESDEECKAEFSKYESWSYLARQGYECVPVDIKELEQ